MEFLRLEKDGERCSTLFSRRTTSYNREDKVTEDASVSIAEFFPELVPLGPFAGHPSTISDSGTCSSSGGGAEARASAALAPSPSAPRCPCPTPLVAARACAAVCTRTCGEGQVCENDTCVDAPCGGCASGESCVDDACAPDACAPTCGR